MMSSGLLVALGLSAFAFLLCGVRSWAHALLFLAYLPFVSFDAEQGGLRDLSGLGSEAILLKMLIRLVTSAALLFLLFRRRGALAHVLRPRCWPILLFVTWAAAGLIRVQAPWVAMFRLGELLVFFLIGVTLYLEGDRFRSPRIVARMHCLALLPLCLASLYMAWSQPELAFHSGLAGVRLGHLFVEANVLGFAACVVLLWATHEMREDRENVRHLFFERVLPPLVLVVAVAVLFYSRSRTAMITAIAGQFLLWFPFHRGDARRRLLFVLFVLAMLTTLAVKSGDVIGWFLRGDSVVSLMSGTGRTGLWQALLTEQVSRAPLFGTGYLTLSAAGHFEHAGIWWTNAHNTFIFALVSTGIPGLLAILAITVLPLRAILRRLYDSPDDQRASWVLLFALQTVVAITGITGFGISGYPNPVMLFNFAIYLYCVSTPLPAPAAAGSDVPDPQARSRRYCIRSRTPTPVPHGPPW